MENKGKSKHDSMNIVRGWNVAMADENDSGGHNTLHVYDLEWTQYLEMNDGLPLAISPIFVLVLFFTNATYCIDPITTPFGHLSMQKCTNSMLLDFNKETEPFVLHFVSCFSKITMCNMCVALQSP